MRRLFEQTNFFWLTLALVSLILTGALAREFEGGVALRLLQGSNVALLAVSLLSLRLKRRRLGWLVALLGLMLVSAVLRGATESNLFDASFLLLMAVFLLAAAWLVADQVLLTGSVDLNTVVGSIALYLLIGQIFAIVYTLLLQYSPAALSGIVPGPWYHLLSQANYFSLITLTTTGYGDIHPQAPIAQAIAAIEGVTGMFYMALVVASLIGAFLGRRRAPE
jgi:hypothetical protein